jgi:hypothetical protein
MSALPPDSMSPKPRITGRRAASRVRLFIPAKVMLLQGLEKCTLDDLSQTGARITLPDHMPRTGSGALLMIEKFEFFGTVIWVSGKRFGLEFEEALPLPQVVMIRHFADDFAQHEQANSRSNARSFVQGRPRFRPTR